MRTPDLIVTGARILTMDPASPRAEALAVKGDRILALGKSDEIDRLAGPGTRVIEADGRTLLPGFVEAHMHLFAGAAEMQQLHLDGVRGETALTGAVRLHAAANPGLEVLIAQGADFGMLGDDRITRHVLDRVLPDRPLLVGAFDHHTMWANTAALQAAGLLEGRATPPGSEVVMGADGLADGELRETPAFGPILKLAGADRPRLGLDTGGNPDPAPTPAQRAEDLTALRAGLALAARHGITSITNMDGNRYTLDLLAELRAKGELTARVKVPFHLKPFMPLSALVEASALSRDFDDDWLTCGMVKMFADGVIDSYTAAMLSPYADRPDWVGEPLFSPDEFARAAVEIDRRGLQIAVHAIGDAAVRMVIDGYAAAQAANGPRDSRHRIEHIEVIHPDDLLRLAVLGITASMQPPHPPGAMDVPLEPTLTRLGPQRLPFAFATADIAATGVDLCFASDWPVSDISVLRGIQAAVTRAPLAPGLSDQRLSLHQTLAAYTRGGARAEHREDLKGTLRPGLAADLVLLGGDIEQTAPERISGLGIALTVCGGRITHAAAPFA